MNPNPRALPLGRRLGRGLVAFVWLALNTAPVSPAGACSVCQCGDPTYRLLGDDVFGDRSWHLSLDMDHLGKDQIAEDFPSGRETENEKRLTGSAAWSPVPRVRLVGRLPVAWRSIEDPAGTQSLFGFSDPDLYAHVDVFRRERSSASWTAVMVGVKTAWGQSDRTLEGTRADEHLQPGSGAASLFAGLSGSVAGNTSSHLYASAMGRWNGENAHRYRYGDVVMANLAYRRGLSRGVSASGELNFRASEKDRNGDELDPNTGGTVLYVTPKLSIRMTGPMVLRLGVQVPVYQNLFGDQNEHVNLQTGVTVTY